MSTSHRYIASGSAARSPIGNATVGEVGETRTSNREGALEMLCAMSVRTFCAWP